MREVLVELKALRLHGMAGAWAELEGLGQNSGVDTARWLIEHLLQADARRQGHALSQTPVAKRPIPSPSRPGGI